MTFSAKRYFEQKERKVLFMNLPNKLTILRICMVPIFVVCLMLPNALGNEDIKVPLYIVSAVVFFLSAVTDFADGKIARKYNLITNFGKFMDPLADKFMVIGALIASIYAFEEMRLWLVITTIVVVFREFAVTSMRLVAVNAEHVAIAAAMPGKIKTFSQCIFIELLILEPMIFSFSDFFVTYRPLTYICMAVVIFFTLYSGALYFKAYKKYITM